MTSFHLSIDPRSRKAGRFLRQVRQELQNALVEEKAERKLTQAELARILGVDRSVINRQLMGKGNISLRAIADFAWALNRDIKFKLTKPVVNPGCNHTPQTAVVPAHMPSSLTGVRFDATATRSDKAMELISWTTV